MSDVRGFDTAPGAVELATVTLATCDSEPIHIPGAIQPHGVLLAVTEHDLVVRHASASTGPLLGIPQADVLGRSLETILDAASVLDVREATSSSSLREQNPLKLRPRDGNALFDGILHRATGLLVIELEPTTNAEELTFGQFYRRVRKAVGRLRETNRVLELATLAAEEVRSLTGFDRVMVYRFAHDGSGEVIAEARGDDLSPFLGLHYPASDIPAQARRLYLLNWLRLIADVGYTPSPILPVLDEARGEPLDLSYSVLRSVSPIHIEYLTNMGVRASMSISLVVDGKLWGLVACHHYAPRFVPYEARSAAEFLGEALSWQIAARERSDTFEQQAAAHRTLSKLVEKMTSHANPVEGLAAAEDDLLGLVSATGAALFHDGKRVLVGETPPFLQVQAFVRWLAEEHPWEQRVGAFVSDALGHDHPTAPRLDGVVGVLATSITAEEGDFLLWFRPEVQRTVCWAGEPEKTTKVEDGIPRLSPRGSFALWKETVRGTAIPFTPWQADLASELRNVILGGIQKRTVELTRLNEELRASNFAKDEFLATVSHELRTPLNAMLGWLQLIETGDLPISKRQHAMETITRNARNQAKLVEDLLDVSRITSGKMRLDVQAVDPVNAVESALESVRPAAEAKKIKLEAILDPKAGPITGDPQRLQQVVWNLLTNAIKFTNKEGRIKVRLERVDSSVEITVSDDGMGIRPEFLPHVFDRFRQADGATRRNHKGLGLGLAIVKHLVELHGGQVFASSEGEGEGATFVVRLPTAPVRTQAGAHPGASESTRFVPTSELAGLRILVVDDEPDATELLGTVLATCGVVVTSARSGFEALEILQKTKQDILVSDVGMPGMDGFDLIRQVRTLPPEQNARIAAVALTAFTRTQDRARAFLAGFDVYLPKPVDAGELVALLVSLRGRVASTQAQPEIARVSVRPTPVPEADGALEDARILLVESPGRDDCALLATILKREGAKVELMHDGASAYACTQSFRPDLLVCAATLPDENGFSLLRRLRGAGSGGGGFIPAVALLETGSPEEVRKALLAGYQLHVARPVSLDVLVARITKLIGWSLRRT